MLSILDVLLNSLSMGIDTSKTERKKQKLYALWSAVFVIAFVVANVT